MAIPSGDRDKLITIDAGTPGTGSSGQPITVWADYARAWMQKRDVSGSERMAAASLNARVDSEFEMAYRSDMDPDLVDVPKTRRLWYAGRVYNIMRATVEQRHDGKAILLITMTTAGR